MRYERLSAGGKHTTREVARSWARFAKDGQGLVEELVRSRGHAAATKVLVRFQSRAEAFVAELENLVGLGPGLPFFEGE